jgi:hypothetical protein
MTMGVWRNHPTGPYREIEGGFRAGLYRDVPSHSTSKYRNFFTADDDHAIRNMRDRGCGIAEIAKALGRSYGAIKARGNRHLGVTFKFPPRKNIAGKLGQASRPASLGA